MPSPVIEQIRQQFYAQMGINEYTPISEADAPNLIDQWEQYLFSAAQQSGSIYQPAPTYQPAPAPRYASPVYVPPGQRTTYQPGQIYSVPGGGTYVGPPRPGTVVGPSTGRVTVAPAPHATPSVTGGSTPPGPVFKAPPPKTH